jgi:hypothetical protein
VLQACSTLIVCATNAAAFRAQYAVSPSVQVFGPWNGVLDDDGETLKLLKPGTPEADGEVPYYRVDHVSYRTNAPWPQTVAGWSVERVPLEAYGNDPADWRAGPPDGTPGVPASNRPPVITVIGNPIIPQEARLTLAVTVADLDVPWQTVTLVPTQLPPGSTFDPALRTLVWTPSAAQGPGDFTARFVATDRTACGTNETALDLLIQVIRPLLVSAQFSPDALQVSFPAVAGETYRVEYCTDLTLADWQLLEEITPSQTQTLTLYDVDVGQGATRFYRVRWMREGD